MISSTANSQIKNIIQLQKKSKERRQQGVFVIEGIKMFEESLEYGNIQKAYVSNHLFEELQKNKVDYFKDIPYEIVTDSVFKDISDTLTPQGILAIVKMPSYSLTDLISREEANLVLLEDIRDPGNLGTILRTAEGAGFTGIILSKESVDMYNPKVIRSTMGAIYRMPFLYVDNFLETLTYLKENGITIYAAHLQSDYYHDEVTYEDRCAIMIGNEANGLSDESSKCSSKYIKIPMSGKVESLNAAVATSVLMYEIYRQRRLRK